MQILPFFRKKDRNKQEAPTLFMTKEAFAKIRDYSDLKDVEVMLFGEVEVGDNNTYTITDFHVPPQEKNSSAFVTTHDDKYSEWLNQMSREQRKKLRVHYHTHPKNMSTTPSATDENTISDKVENITDYYIRIIGNSKDSFHVDFFDIKNHLLFKEIDIFIQAEEYLTIKATKDGISIVTPRRKEAEKELDDKMVKSPSPKPIQNSVSFQPKPPTQAMDPVTKAEHLAGEIRAYQQGSAQTLTYQQLIMKLKPKEITSILQELRIKANEWEQMPLKEKLDHLDTYLDQYYDMIDDHYQNAYGGPYGQYY